MGVVLFDCSVPVSFIINSETVIRLLTRMNVDKAMGPDDILSWILRDHVFILACPITTIFT